jgi:hypothetical protein
MMKAQKRFLQIKVPTLAIAGAADFAPPPSDTMLR